MNKVPPDISILESSRRRLRVVRRQVGEPAILSERTAPGSPVAVRVWCDWGETSARRALVRRVCAALAIVPLSACGKLGPAPRAPTQELVLTELRSTRLPDDVAVDGAAFDPGLGIYVWSAGGLWLWADSDPNLVAVCPGVIHSPQAVVRTAVGGEIAVIERVGEGVGLARGKALCRRWSDSVATLVARRVRALASSTVTLVRGDDARLRYLRADQGTRAKLIAVSLHDGSLSTLTIADAILRISSASTYSAVAKEAEVLIAEQLFPYRIVSTDSVGRQMRLLEPTAQLAASTRAALLSGWIALPPVPVQPGLLLVFADPTSDRRLFLTVDEDGLFGRAVEVDVAIAFLAVDQAQHRLAAVRDVGSRELVLYSWRWRRKP